jgi:hypothetical protein
MFKKHEKDFFKIRVSNCFWQRKAWMFLVVVDPRAVKGVVGKIVGKAEFF